MRVLFESAHMSVPGPIWRASCGAWRIAPAASSAERVFMNATAVTETWRVTAESARERGAPGSGWRASRGA